jgi:hypothetical protein
VIDGGSFRRKLSSKPAFPCTSYDYSDGRCHIACHYYAMWDCLSSQHNSLGTHGHGHTRFCARGRPNANKPTVFEAMATVSSQCTPRALLLKKPNILQPVPTGSTQCRGNSCRKLADVGDEAVTRGSPVAATRKMGLSPFFGGFPGRAKCVGEVRLGMPPSVNHAEHDSASQRTRA